MATAKRAVSARVHLWCQAWISALAGMTDGKARRATSRKAPPLSRIRYHSIGGCRGASHRCTMSEGRQRCHGGGRFMQQGGNKEVVSRYFLQGIGGLNPDVVDEVFAPEHRLTSPEFGTEPETGTQIIKDAIEGFRRDAGDVTCTVESQIEADEWVATIYTLSDEHDRHMGIMISRVADG